ncbi:hypothetical protein M3F59_08495 [Brachybacterium muris]|uniref:hypothetical protein n=1 Tax=Brachybacterium muris TaxID=219301 RepID=UPI00223B6993|nr:hypothetical protein [Brachybacterium muris]MCT2261650.1 hypothetical protein [Brachybacterium muris]
MVDQDRLQQWRQVVAQEAQAGNGSDTETADRQEIPGFAEQDAPWRFETLVANLSQTADRVLDLGEELPEAADGTYDLVVCRFGAFDAHDVAGLLQPDGTFLTEQAGSDDLAEVLDDLGGASSEPSVPRASLMDMENSLVRAGLTIERADAFRGKYTFDDPGALLRYIARMPWLPSVQPDAPGLDATLTELASHFEEGPLEATASRFVLLARAPGIPDSGRLDLSSLPDDDLEVPRV